MRTTSLGAFVASAALASATVLGGAGAASAQQDEGPVQFSAEGGDNCEVIFTVQNQTNSKFYTIDYQIDGEFDGHEDGTWDERKHAGSESGDIRWGAHSEIADDTDEFQAGVTGYVSNLDPVTSTKTVNLRDLDDLPNPEADEHTIQYRLIYGPHTPHRDDANIYTTSVTGCADSTDPSDGSVGSAELFGSLKSLIGSIDFGGSLGSLTAS